MKKVTVSSLKKKLWKLFSEYIRRLYADWRGYVACVTCGSVKHYKEQQAGHFIPGRHNMVLFDERNVHPQCYRCNIALSGNPRKYDKYMRLTYGPEIIEQLEKLDEQNKQFTIKELEELIKEYKDKLKTLS